MKHKWNLFFLISLVLCFVFASSNAGAIMWSKLGAAQFSSAAKTPGSNGFECTVQDITEENGVRHVTCLVGDVISGSYQTGETRVLNFPVGSSTTRAMTLRLGMMEAPPVAKGYQYLLFTTQGNFGPVLIGGTANGFFQGTKTGDGKTVYFNGYNNMNLVPNPTASDYGNNSTVKLMQVLKTSGLPSKKTKNHRPA